MNEPNGYTVTPTGTFKWFPLIGIYSKFPVAAQDNGGKWDHLSHYELRQAFSCSDGRTRWKAIPIATDTEQQEEVDGVNIHGKMTESVTDDFCECFATKADCTGFMSRMIATLELPEGVNPDDARVKQIVAWCQENNPA